MYHNLRLMQRSEKIRGKSSCRHILKKLNAQICLTLPKGKRYFFSKIDLTYCEKKLTSDQDFFLKFKTESHEFAKIVRSIEQFTRTVKGQYYF